jgi:phytoene dehydrogenase-like protein
MHQDDAVRVGDPRSPQSSISTVPNGAINCAMMALLALFFNRPKNRKTEIRPLF